MRPLVVAVLLAVVGPACRSEPTQTWVFVHADPGFAREATTLRVVVESAGEVVLDRVTDSDVFAGREIIANLYLVPRDGDARRTWAIHATLLRGDIELAHLRAGGGYSPAATRVVHAHFETDAACRDLGDCGAGRTCQGGRCVGSCFEHVDPDDSDPRQLARCGECATCVAGECQPLPNGDACGCDGDACRDGECAPAVSVHDVWVGAGHACARTSDGLWCWGNSRQNQTSLGVSTDRPRPVEAPEVAGVVDMALAKDHTCAIMVRSGPEHWRTCWGLGSHGSFATGQYYTEGLQSFVEVRQDETDVIVDIDAGDFFMCVRRQSGRVQCAGGNDSGQLGLPDAVPAASDWVDIPGRYVSVSTSEAGVCAVTTEGEVWCWGHSTFDGLVRSPELECVPGPEGTCFDALESVQAGSARACGLDAFGAAWCWGGNQEGLLGVEGQNRVLRATPLDTDLRFSFLESSKSGFCGLDDIESGLYCWGPNQSGQLGVGSRVDIRRPTRVEVDAHDRWTTVAMHQQYACGIRRGGELYCWGDNLGPGSGGNVAGRLGLGLGTRDEPMSDVVVTRPRRVCFERP